MPARLFVLALLVAGATGCTWDDRPDGAEAVRSASGGFYEYDAAPQATPLGGSGDAVGFGDDVEPLGAPTPEAPVDLTQPPPTTGTADNTSEVEEALTPGTEQ